MCPHTCSLEMKPTAQQISINAETQHKISPSVWWLLASKFNMFKEIIPNAIVKNLCRFLKMTDHCRVIVLKWTKTGHFTSKTK